MSLMIARSLYVLVLVVPAWSQSPGPPRPGSINYLEGQASIGIPGQSAPLYSRRTSPSRRRPEESRFC